MGGSLGAMQALQWAIAYPERIAPCHRRSPRRPSCRRRTSLSTRWRARRSPPIRISTAAISTPTTWCRAAGLRLARMIGHITYLSDDAMMEKFGRSLRSGAINFHFDVDFEVESYLRHQGDKFSEYFDANTYLLITRGAGLFRPGRGLRRRPDARARAGQGALPRRFVHLGLALRAGALARNRQGAARQPRRRLLCGNRRTARARRVPARRCALPRAGARLLRQCRA